MTRRRRNGALHTLVVSVAALLVSFAGGWSSPLDAAGRNGPAEVSGPLPAGLLQAAGNEDRRLGSGLDLAGTVAATPFVGPPGVGLIGSCGRRDHRNLTVRCLYRLAPKASPPHRA